MMESKNHAAVSNASGPLAAATSHQTTRSVPKYSAPPVMRCMIDIAMVGRNR